MSLFSQEMQDARDIMQDARDTAQDETSELGGGLNHVHFLQA
jgi:hypothetical protein